MKYQLFYFFLFQLAIIRSQICNLRNAENNLITIASGEIYEFRLSDYFFGDSLVFTLNKQYEYFQASNQYQPGKYLKNIKSISSFNIKGKAYSLLFAHFVLIERTNEDGTFYQISKISQDYNKFTFSVSVFISQKLYKNCYNINQFKLYLLVTCVDQEQKNLEFYFYNSESIYSNPLSVMFPLDQEINFENIKTLSAGDYVGIQLIADNEQLSGDLLIFKFSLNKKEEFETQLVGEFKDINSFELTEDKLFFVTNSEAGFTYCNLRDDTIDIIENDIINEIYFGISFYEIQTMQEYYQITLWNQQGIVIFIWNPNKPITIHKYFHTTQISRENSFNTDVYVNEMYLIISNINGISIYPSIFNDQNEGHQLYYYQVKSLFSSYHFKQNFLFSIQPKGLFVYEIDNYILQLPIVKSSKEIQKVTLNARTNQFNTPSVDCPQFVFYFQVLQSQSLQPFNKFTYIGERFYQSDIDEEKPVFKIQLKQSKQENNIYTGKINLNQFFFGASLTIDKLILENSLNQKQQIIKIKQNELKTQKIVYQDADQDYENLVLYSFYFERILSQSLRRKDQNCYFQVLQNQGVHKINKSFQWQLIFQVCCFNDEQQIHVCEKLMEEPQFKFKILNSYFHEYNNNLYLYLQVGVPILPSLYISKFEILDGQYRWLSRNFLNIKCGDQNLFFNVMKIISIKDTLCIFYEIRQNLVKEEKLKILVRDFESILKDNKCLTNEKDYDAKEFLDNVSYIEHIYGPFIFARAMIYDELVKNSFRQSLFIYIIDQGDLIFVGEIRNKKENSTKKYLQIDLIEEGLLVFEILDNQNIYFYSKSEVQKILIQIQTQQRTIYFEDIPRKQLFFKFGRLLQYDSLADSIFKFQIEPNRNVQTLTICYLNHTNGFLENRFLKTQFSLQKEFNYMQSIKRNGKDFTIFQELEHNKQGEWFWKGMIEVEWDNQQEFQFSIPKNNIEEQNFYYLNLMLSSDINEEVKKEKFQTQLKVQFEILDENELQDQNIEINQ